MQLGKLGVWAFTDALTAREAAAFAQRVERWGYSALWFPEAMGRNSLVHAAWLLASTERLIVATGIANIYARDPTAMRAAQLTLQAPNYTNSLLRLGFVESDFAGGGSDRLLDALVTWGDEDAIRARLQAHWDAGADHVCVQALHPDPAQERFPDPRLLELLAPGV